MRKRHKNWFGYLIPSLFVLYLVYIMTKNCFYDEGSHEKLSFSNSSHRNLPKCLVIGVRKGGTRALLDMISLHSKIKSARTEIHFFDTESNFQRGLDWYSNRMPETKEDEISIEKTPSYFVSTPQVPERVYRMNKTIRLLLIVRDPVTRLISDYTQILYNHLQKEMEFKPFEELCLDANGDVNTRYDAISRSIYANYMKTWLKFFSLKQIHIVNGDRLIHKPWQEIKKVEKFLNLNHEITRNHFYFNVSKGFHCFRSLEKKADLRCLAKSKGRQHPNISRTAIKKLRMFFRPFNYDFYNLVNVDFGWPEE